MMVLSSLAGSAQKLVGYHPWLGGGGVGKRRSAEMEIQVTCSHPQCRL